MDQMNQSDTELSEDVFLNKVLAPTHNHPPREHSHSLCFVHTPLSSRPIDRDPSRRKRHGWHFEKDRERAMYPGRVTLTSESPRRVKALFIGCSFVVIASVYRFVSDLIGTAG